MTVSMSPVRNYKLEGITMSMANVKSGFTNEKFKVFKNTQGKSQYGGYQ